MRYKILLTGKNNSTINDFFTQMEDCFELLTTSGRFRDISNHLKYFTPDMFVCCLSQNTKESLNQMIMLKRQFEKNDIPFIIIGTEEECSNFSQYAIHVADFVLVQPLSASMIRNRILDYMKTRQQVKDETEQEFTEQELAELARAEQARIEQERAEQARIEQENIARRKHILIVDDDPLMLRVIREQLHEKYDIATANSGRTALKFLQKKKTDLILLDYEMPVENGPSVLQKLHADDITKDIPVVFLTGIKEYGKIQKALVQKPQGYLLKPVDHDKLFETISKLIG